MDALLRTVARALVPGGALLVGRLAARGLEVLQSVGFSRVEPGVAVEFGGGGVLAQTLGQGAMQIGSVAGEPAAPFRDWVERAGLGYLLCLPLPTHGAGLPVLLLGRGLPFSALSPESRAQLTAVGLLLLEYSRLLRRRHVPTRPRVAQGVLVCGEQGEVLAADRGARLLVGRPAAGAAEFLGRALGADIAACLEGRRPRAREVSLPGRRGEVRLSVSVHPLQGGAATGQVSVFIRDLTRARGRPDDRTRLQLTALGELAAGAAHEIRNPLTAVRGFLQLVSARLNDQEQAHYLQIVEREIDRIDRLTGDLLLMSRAGGGPPVPCDITEVVRGVAELLRRQAQDAGVTLVSHLGANLPRVWGDPARLEQVLLNLLSNALDATPARASVEVFVHASVPGWLDIRIRDQGCGIPPAVLPRIFDPFFTTKPGGTGLGLALSERIVRAMGGRITVLSPPGEGATFTVRLPLQPRRRRPPVGAVRPLLRLRRP